MNKKKILLVTRNFPPLVGGMEKLNFNIFNSLSPNFDVSIAGPNGSSSFHKMSNFIEFSPAPLWKYLIASLLSTIRLSQKVRPDIVFCGSGAAILAGYFAAKFTGAKLVCYLHGLDIVANSHIYQNVFIPLIKKSNLIIVNSHHTQKLAIEAGFNVALIKILAPGTHLPDIDNRVLLQNQFREQYKLQNDPIILIAGRLTQRKGVVEFIENVMPALLVKYPQLKLVIIGEEATQAITHQLGIKDKIINRIEALSLNNSVCVLGGVDDNTLSAALFSAEMLVFPILEIPNDVEGFGMVAIEAAAHGTPTIGFSVGGVPDAIAVGKSGWLVLSGEYEKMGEVILHHLAFKQISEITSESCINFAREFDWKIFGEKLCCLLAEDIL